MNKTLVPNFFVSAGTIWGSLCLLYMDTALLNTAPTFSVPKLGTGPVSQWDPEKKSFLYYSNCAHFLCGSVYSHRRSGKVTARKTNRTALFGQPLGWLFFCRSERSISIASAAAGKGTITTIPLQEDNLSAHDTYARPPQARHPVSHRLPGSEHERPISNSEKWRSQK